MVLILAALAAFLLLRRPRPQYAAAPAPSPDERPAEVAQEDPAAGNGRPDTRPREDNPWASLAARNGSHTPEPHGDGEGSPNGNGRAAAGLVASGLASALLVGNALRQLAGRRRR